MLRTITLGSCVSVQGIFVKKSDDGLVTVKVDDKMYCGTPVIRHS